MIIRNFSSLLLVLLARRSSSFASASIPTVLKSHQQHGFDSNALRQNKHVGGWIHQRGGHQPPPSSQPLLTRRHMATIDKPLSSSSLEEVALKDSMSIVGNNIRRSEFGGVSYYNTALMPEYRVLFVLGGPGAGKGTQSELMKENYPCVHLSVGELLRDEQTRLDSPHRALIQECLVGGSIVPVEISLALLERAMEEAAIKHGRSLLYLVDGFPRNYDNLEGWNRCMRGVSSVWGVLMYTCPLEILEERILARAATSGRSDDNLKSAQKRFRTFEQETVPVVNTLRRVQELQQSVESGYQGMPCQVLDLKGDQTIEQVWSDTQATMNSVLANDVWTANAKVVQAIETDDTSMYREVCTYFGAGDNAENKDSLKAMEGEVGKPLSISNASIIFETGTKAITSYDREVEGQTVRESRVWSYEGSQGWVNVHFSRMPLSSS
jgi:UMP-CMP kinase